MFDILGSLISSVPNIVYTMKFIRTQEIMLGSDIRAHSVVLKLFNCNLIDGIWSNENSFFLVEAKSLIR